MHPVQTGLFWLFVAGPWRSSPTPPTGASAPSWRACPTIASTGPWERLKGLLLYAFVQKRMVRDRYAGLFHLLIFWGFCVLAAPLRGPHR